jgi:single-stranded-DNA-specific exonuclease
VVVTVDCGIRSVEEVKFGQRLGLDLIITDHHHVGEALPPAVAAINPKQPGCVYSFKELAGVGLAYKLAQALIQAEALRARSGQLNLHQDNFIDLVAVGTVADLAPLYGENRRLVERGLRQLNHALRPGLAALLQQSRSQGKTITAETIGFVIGPRLNAAGRLDSALAAYQLLMAPTYNAALELASELDRQNRERQALTATMVDMARQTILVDRGQSPLYFISHAEFNPGVVGLAASRLTDEFYRPVLIAEQGREKTKGSARSIREFHITQALDHCADLLIRYGGHAAAAGFTLRNEDVPALQERLLQLAREKLNVAELRPTLTIDAIVKLRGVRFELVEAITRLQPFGYGNPTPQFLSQNVRVKHKRTVGQDEQHLRLVLHDGRQDWSAIAFRQGHWRDKLALSQEIDIVYNLEINEWNGEKSLQLNIKDLRPSR